MTEREMKDRYLEREQKIIKNRRTEREKESNRTEVGIRIGNRL